MIDILVKELRPEHRDREWVDNQGCHWAWCEDEWMWRWPLQWNPDSAWTPAHKSLPGWHHDHCEIDAAMVTAPFDEYMAHRAPFMEALHHRVIYEGRR